MKVKIDRKAGLGIILGCVLAILTAVIWVAGASTNCVRWPITFGPYNTPYTEVNIDGEIYPLEINLGTKFALALNRKILTQISKKPSSMITSRDFAGQQNEFQSYYVSKVKIGDLTYKNVLVREISEADQFPDDSGVIGRPLLEAENLMLDFPNSTILVTKDNAHLQARGYFLEDMVNVPFTTGRLGIILQVETDWGTTKLLLTTGASHSHLKAFFTGNSKQELQSARFVIGGKDFGSMIFATRNFSNELLEIDGILGMDFLKAHTVYIDNDNKVAYFGGF